MNGRGGIVGYAGGHIGPPLRGALLGQGVVGCGVPRASRPTRETELKGEIQNGREKNIGIVSKFKS